MKHWEQKDLKFLLNSKYFPKCIECEQTYFHKRDCSRVLGNTELSISMDIIDERLDKRLEEFERKYGINGHGIKCKYCENIAVGEMHVLYHHSNSTIEQWPVCIDHAFYEDSEGRESQFRGF